MRIRHVDGLLFVAALRAILWVTRNLLTGRTFLVSLSKSMERSSQLLSRSLSAALAAVLLVLAGARAAPAPKFALEGLTVAVACDFLADAIADCDDGCDLCLSAVADPESPDEILDAALLGGWNGHSCAQCVASLEGIAELREASGLSSERPVRGPPSRAC